MNPVTLVKKLFRIPDEEKYNLFETQEHNGGSRLGEIILWEVSLREARKFQKLSMVHTTITYADSGWKTGDIIR